MADNQKEAEHIDGHEEGADDEVYKALSTPVNYLSFD